MRFDFVCSRPAVSISTMSARRATAASRASNTTAGSAPGACATMSTPALSAQIRSWSLAAARNVSAAARTTRLPAAAPRVASLPMVVVLPVPLTPTIRTTAGRVSWTESRQPASRGTNSEVSSRRTAAAAPSGAPRSRARSTTSVRKLRADVAGDPGSPRPRPRSRDRSPHRRAARGGGPPTTAAATKAVLEVALARFGSGHPSAGAPAEAPVSDPAAPAPSSGPRAPSPRRGGG